MIRQFSSSFIVHYPLNSSLIAFILQRIQKKENNNDIIITKIENATDGLSYNCFNLLSNIIFPASRHNTLTISDYISSMKSEINQSDHYRRDVIILFCLRAKFKIENDSTGDFIINFNNIDEEYSFRRTFSRNLLDFYQDYDRMTIIHTTFNCRLLHSLVNMNFVYD